MTLKIDQRLQQGRYRIRDRLGQGGMGTVYLAEDLNLAGRLVAIKENIDTSPEAQEQFKREAMTLASLTHPNLPRVTDHFIELSGRQYLVMDYVQGDDLRQLLQQHAAPIPEKVALAWIEQVLDALNYMHHWVDPATKKLAPIIHRDIKPGNIKQASDGRIVLVDFGLAKPVEGSVTLQGARAVTHGYSPIEQYTGGSTIRSDIYALGATLYSLVTGQKPPEAPALATGTTLPLPRKLNPTLSRATERVILRAMQLQPNDRYASVQEMHAALFNKRQTKRITNKPMAPFTPGEQTGPPVRKARAWWEKSLDVGIAILLLLLIASSLLVLVVPNFMSQFALLPKPAATESLALLPALPTQAPSADVADSLPGTATPTTLVSTALSSTKEITTPIVQANEGTVVQGDETTATDLPTTVLTATVLPTHSSDTDTLTATPTLPLASTAIGTQTVAVSSLVTATSTSIATSTLRPTESATSPATPVAAATAMPTVTPSTTATPTRQPTVAPTNSATPTRNQTVIAEQTRQAELRDLARKRATLTAVALLPTATSSVPTPMATMIATATPFPSPTATVLLPTPTSTMTQTPTPNLTVMAEQTAFAYATLEQSVLATLTGRAPTATRIPATATTTITRTPTKPTATLTSTSTSTPLLPITNTPVPTNTLPPTPQPTATPVLPVGGSLALLEPLEAVLNGRRTFRWSTDIALTGNQYFEVVFWPAGRDPMSSAFGPVGSIKEMMITVDLDKTADTLPALFQSGQNYEWGVLLVELNPYRRLQYLGGGQRFRFERSSGGGGGGEGAPAPTNTPRG